MSIAYITVSVVIKYLNIEKLIVFEYTFHNVTYTCILSVGN